MIPNSILNSDDDWMESTRSYLYPKIHPLVKRFGGYSIGKVTEDQYIGYFSEDEESIEGVFVDLGFERNPIAAFKTHSDGRTSEGSWAITSENDPSNRVSYGRQLHITLFEREDSSGRDLYAHYEDDWRVNPIAHLRCANFSPSKGVSIGKKLLNERTSVVTING